MFTNLEIDKELFAYKKGNYIMTMKDDEGNFFLLVRLDWKNKNLHRFLMAQLEPIQIKQYENSLVDLRTVMISNIDWFIMEVDVKTRVANIHHFDTPITECSELPDAGFYLKDDLKAARASEKMR